MNALPNRLGRTREMSADVWIHRYANGLVVHTDPFMRADAARVLPIGGPQDTIMNRLVNRPETVTGKRVLDSFAGSGVFGLMALKLGAEHVDFVDINPRAERFQTENCARNGFAAASYEAILASVAEFRAAEPYDVVLANPPFVMTPPAIGGTLTSSAGPDGNDLVVMLLARLEEFLKPHGEALIYVLQLVQDGAPLVARAASQSLRQRPVRFTPVQTEIAPLEHYVSAYRLRFPQHNDGISVWADDLRTRHGADVGVQHYIIHVGARGEAATAWSIEDDLAENYGEGLAYPSASLADLALGRVAENFIPPAPAGGQS